MNKNKIFAGLVLTILLLSIPLAITGQARESESSIYCRIYEAAKKALDAIKERDCERAIVILERTLEIDCDNMELMGLLQSALDSLRNFDVNSAAMFLRAAMIMCKDLM